MLIYFDESGDFAFPDDGFDAYVQAAVICPDSRVASVEHFVSEMATRWDVSEIHASSLSPGKILRICRYLAQSDLRLQAQATDTDLITRRSLATWRAGQARRLEQNLRWYREGGGQVPEIEQWLTARAKGSQYPSRISDVEFIQATLLIDLLHGALQIALLFYRDEEWRDDLVDFRFILDGKLPGKLGHGEKFLQHVLVPALGSNRRFDLSLPDSWRDAEPPHPFITKFEKSGGWSGSRRRHVDEDVLDLAAMFEHGLQFEPSERHAGIQIADVVANLVRRVIVDPSDSRLREAYDLLRPKLRGLNRQALRLVRLSTGGVERADRYRHLI